MKERGDVKQRGEPGQRPRGGREHGALEELQEGECSGVRGTFQNVVRDEVVAAGPSRGRSIRSLLCQTNALKFDIGKRQTREGF